MTDALITLGYVGLIVLTGLTIARMDFRHLSFADGTVFAVTYYLAIPLFATLWTGSLENHEIGLPSYRPTADLGTTLNLYCGWLLVLAFRNFFRRQTTGLPERSYPLRPAAVFWLFVGSYTALGLIFFFVSGKGAGGHWQQNLESSFKGSTLTIVLAQFINAFRTMVFGFLVYLHGRGIFSSKKAIVIAGAIGLFDMAVTFNRITAVYGIIVLLIVLRKRLYLLVPGLIAAFPAVSYLSHVWASFRGLAIYRGFSISNLQLAFDLALNSMASVQGSLSTTLNNIFEASSLIVFNSLVQDVPERFQLLWGSTFFVKTWTFFIPSTIWPERPLTFAVQLGAHFSRVQGLSLSSTLFGEAYGNFYFLWPLPLLASLVVLEWVFYRLGQIRRHYSFFGCFVAVGLWRFEMTFATISIMAILVFELLQRFLMPIVALPNRPGLGSRRLQSRLARPQPREGL